MSLQHLSLDFESRRSPVLGTRGMVATSQPLAVSAGLRALRSGGNAADAAIATAAALAVTEPCNTGLGGDCFGLYFESATGRVTAMNGSGRSAAALDLERLRADGLDAELPATHAHTITVPGACAGWCDWIERHGRRTLADALEPAIELAEEGFPVAPFTALLWKRGVPLLSRAPSGRELMIDGRAPRAGERFRNPTLARTLRTLAAGGRDAFYEGRIGEAIVAAARTAGGVLAPADLADHRGEWVEPISTTYRGAQVWECPPNGQGIAALLALNLLRGFDLEGLAPGCAERTHLTIEAMRLAFADARYYVADPAFGDLPLEVLLSESYAADRRSLIDPARALTGPAAGSPASHSDTVYLCCVDGDGNACSFINSNYMGFGTGLVPEGCGFTLQNRGFGFSLDPAHPNALRPRKRPYHTIIPGLVTRAKGGGLVGPFGVMGGFAQPQGHLQVVSALVDDDLDPQTALDRPRFGVVAGDPSGPVALEPGFPEGTADALRALGHDIRPARGWARMQFGWGQMIVREPSGTLWGGSDPRADGCAMCP